MTGQHRGGPSSGVASVWSASHRATGCPSGWTGVATWLGGMRAGPTLTSGCLPDANGSVTVARRGIAVAVLVAHLYSDPRAGCRVGLKTSKTVTVLAAVAAAGTAILSLAGGPASATSLRVSADTASSPPKTALAALATLPVKGRAPKTGYSRAQFGPAWTDDVTVAAGHNGCDTRNDILRRDLTAVVIRPGSNGCTVLSGELHDPYTNVVIHFNRADPNVVQIDHVVALGDAWQTGAQQLTLKLRTNFANDPLELLAVSGTANEQKGDADAESWLPPNKAYRCPFVARQVAVKVRYHLWVTPAEHDAIARVLATCPSQALPTTAGTAPPATTTSTTASRSVVILSVTSPVDSGAYASVVAQTAPHAKCDLAVTLPSGRESESSGLVTQTANASGQVEWTWLTGTRTKPGTAKATVQCTVDSPTLRAFSATRTFIFVS